MNMKRGILAISSSVRGLQGEDVGKTTQGVQGRKSTLGFSVFFLTGVPPYHIEPGWVATVGGQGGRLVAVQELCSEGKM